jgi:endonuclease YncB( thermonuclease family)
MGTRSRARSTRRIIRHGLVALLLTLALSASSAVAASPVYRIDHVSDGDTVALRNGQRVRLVQIDTPEVFFGRECYGRAASLRTKTLLPPAHGSASSRSQQPTASISTGGCCATSSVSATAST